MKYSFFLRFEDTYCHLLKVEIKISWHQNQWHMPTSISQSPISISMLWWSKTDLQAIKRCYANANTTKPRFFAWNIVFCSILYKAYPHKTTLLRKKCSIIFDELLKYSSRILGRSSGIPPYFLSFFLTFLVVEVNLAIYMFLESIGSSVCIQYQERYIFLSSSSFCPSRVWTQKTKNWPLCLYKLSENVYFPLFFFLIPWNMNTLENKCKEDDDINAGLHHNYRHCKT